MLIIELPDCFPKTLEFLKINKNEKILPCLRSYFSWKFLQLECCCMALIISFQDCVCYLWWRKRGSWIHSFRKKLSNNEKFLSLSSWYSVCKLSLGPGQKSNFTCEKPNGNKQKLLLALHYVHKCSISHKLKWFHAKKLTAIIENSSEGQWRAFFLAFHCAWFFFFFLKNFS